MKISTKCRYGIRAVIEIAKNHTETPTKRKDISDSQGIPNSYLENILITLKHNRIVSSIRGVGGGFVLKKPPEEITLLEIFEALQGDLSLLDCIEMPESCDRHQKCIIRPVWVEVQQAQKEVLRKISVKDLIDKEDQEFLENL
jgi:Rrf2 family protein